MTMTDERAIATCDVPFMCVSTEVAAQASNRIAVMEGSRALTYGEVNYQADRLARHLRSLGVDVDTPVGLCLPRSLDMVVGALGILRAGGAFVPLDPAHPADRL